MSRTRLLLQGTADMAIHQDTVAQQECRQLITQWPLALDKSVPEFLFYTRPETGGLPVYLPFLEQVQAICGEGAPQFGLWTKFTAATLPALPVWYSLLLTIQAERIASFSSTPCRPTLLIRLGADISYRKLSTHFLEFLITPQSLVFFDWEDPVSAREMHLLSPTKTLFPPYATMLKGATALHTPAQSLNTDHTFLAPFLSTP